MLLPVNNYIQLQDPRSQRIQNPSVDYGHHIPREAATVQRPWQERSILHLENCEKRLDEKIPNSAAQNKIDALGRKIELKFAPLKKFNDRLDCNGNGSWYKQLATFLYKLPIRAVRNIIRLIYNIVKSALYAAVHPLKAVLKLAKLFMLLTDELTKPATWSKIGAGVIGASVGHSFVSGNPFSVIAIGIGTAMVVGGFTAGAIKAALHAEHDARLQRVKDEILKQAIELPESALTGFFIGVITGGIQRVVQDIHQARAEQNIQETDNYVRNLLRDHPYSLERATKTFDPATGKLTINIPLDANFVKAHPDIFYLQGNIRGEVGRYTHVYIQAGPSGSFADAYGTISSNWDHYEIDPFSHRVPANIFGEISPTHAIPPLPQYVTKRLEPLGAIAGGGAQLSKLSK